MDGKTRTHATRAQAHASIRLLGNNIQGCKTAKTETGYQPRQERPVVELADGVLTKEVLPSGLLVPSDMQVPVTGTAACEPRLA